VARRQSVRDVSASPPGQRPAMLVSLYLATYKVKAMCHMGGGECRDRWWKGTFLKSVKDSGS
jgi:hypothetical protein